MTIIMDGIALRNRILNELQVRIKEQGLKPKLVAILVGDDSASKIYVRNKEKYASVAGYITPTPGGTGPMTIAGLMMNTVDLAQKYK